MLSQILFLIKFFFSILDQRAKESERPEIASITSEKSDEEEDDYDTLPDVEKYKEIVR